MIETNDTRLRDAVYQLSVSGQVPDARLLDELVRTHPEYAAELTDIAVSLALDALGESEDQRPGSELTEMSPAVSRAMSRFHNRLYAVRNASTARASPRASAAENPFTDLPRNKLRSLAENLNANGLFVMKLRDRQIFADSISEGFRRRLAEELNVPIEVVVAHLAAESEIQAQTRFKADQKPEAGGKQTFEEAVRSSGLTADQQAFLLSL